MSESANGRGHFTAYQLVGAGGGLGLGLASFGVDHSWSLAAIRLRRELRVSGFVRLWDRVLAFL